MRANTIFRWIWRLNALLILIVGLSVAVVIGVAVYPTIRDYLLRKPLYHSGDMVNIEDVEIDSEWTLGGFRQIKDTGFLISPVYSTQEYSVGSLSKEKSASATRNFLVLNSVDKSTSWVAPTNRYLFLNQSEIYESTNQTGKVLALRYGLVVEDTNKDERLTGEDQSAFALSDIDGRNFTVVIPNIDRFLGEQQPNPDSLMVFYRSGGKNFLSVVQISSKKVVESRELPQING